MNAAATFNAWKDYARAHSKSGAENVFTLDGAAFFFDPAPRELHNGALQGRIYRQGRGQNPVDIGGYKIGADGRVLSLPDELKDHLPASAPAVAEGRS